MNQLRQVAYTKGKSIWNQLLIFCNPVIFKILRKLYQITSSCIIVICQPQNIANADERNIL